MQRNILETHRTWANCECCGKYDSRLYDLECWHQVDSYTGGDVEWEMFCPECQVEHTWVSSDRHLFHKNILKYDQWRKFSSIEEMNEYIISEAEKIPEEDTLIFLGDLCFWHLDEVDLMLDRVKCKKIWVKGNHDSWFTKLSRHFEQIVDKLEWAHSLYTLFIHYPPVDYDGKVRYKPEEYEMVVHWHTHRPQKHQHWRDVSYDGNSKLFYKLSDLEDRFN